MKKLTQAEKIRRYIKANPDKSVSDVAKAIGTSYQIVYLTKRKMNEPTLKKPKDSWKTVLISTSNTAVTEAPVTVEPDPVNHPPHYKTGGIETIDFIEAKQLNYNLGNVVKYVTRADHKGNRKQDLEKAAWYLAREIAKLANT